ncbi:MAG: exopolysaccharide biosynthesis polyprenyl glycosylphosphotransferase [Solirubrobacteraceae bacterium]
MTPVQSGTHAAPASTIVVAQQRHRSRAVAHLFARLLDPRQWQRVQLVGDVAVLCMAASLALFADAAVASVQANRWLAAIFPPAVAMLMRARRTTHERLNASLLDAFAHVVGVVSLAAMLTISVNSILGTPDPIRLASRLWLFSVVYLGVARTLLVSARRQALRTRELAVPTLVVGAGVVGAHVVRRLLDEPGYGLRPVAYLDSDPLPCHECSGQPALPVLGGLENLDSALATTGAKHVILAFTGDRDQALAAKVKQLEAMGIGVSLVPRMFEAINERATLDHLGGLPLLTLRPVDPHGWEFAVKHALDRTIALLALLAGAPVMLAIAVAVRLSSPGPVLFRQRRIGRDGREFDVLKFRTMYEEGSDPARFALPHGVAPGGVEGLDRRTRVGRVLRGFSLDEVPQLINVLRGDMSVVGPRPERPEYVAQFARDVARYEDRHRVKSGITGWAQVNGLRGQTSIADRVEWDNHYIQNWSLGLDLKIMVLTVAEMLRFRDSQTASAQADEARVRDEARERAAA